ncbi:MAG: hypothetical protein ACLUTU_04245 [Blautia faecis]
MIQLESRTRKQLKILNAYNNALADSKKKKKENVTIATDALADSK